MRLHVTFICACVALAVITAHTRAASRLDGDTYTISMGNFPDSFGVTIDPETQAEEDHGSPAVTLTFDGIAETAGGIRVNERAVPWPGQPGGIHVVQAAGVDGETEFDLFDWEAPGEVVELSYETVNGGWIAGDPDAQSFSAVRGLDWRNSKPGTEPFFFETGFYFYWTLDGQAITGYETIQPEIGLLVGPHPFDETVPEVVYIAYSRGQVEDITEPHEGGFDYLIGTTQLDETNGSFALLAFVMGLDGLAETNGKPANGLHWGILVDPPLPGPTEKGDVNQDGLIDLKDINELSLAVREGRTGATYDLDNNGQVNQEDRRVWVDDIKKTYFGDADLDGEFNSGDLVVVFQGGQYEDTVAGNSLWETGDWDGNGDFDSADFIVAFQAGGYERGPRAATAAVPEPAGWTLWFIASAALGIGVRPGRN